MSEFIYRGQTRRMTSLVTPAQATVYWYMYAKPPLALTVEMVDAVHVWSKIIPYKRQKEMLKHTPTTEATPTTTPVNNP